MTQSCCCDTESPINERRYSSDCFCARCPSVRDYVLCLSGMTTNEIPPVSSGPAKGIRPCGSFFHSIRTMLLERGVEYQSSDYYLPFYYSFCNCGYYGKSYNPCFSNSNQVEAWLELEELCLDHSPNNTGHLRRGIREDFNCFGFNYDQEFGASGYPCSPCYNNTGNIRGSIDNAQPFSMECGDEYERFITLAQFVQRVAI